MNEQEFHKQFIGFTKELTSFVFRLVTNKQDTEDLVHDTYLKANKNLPGFKGNSSLKTWVFAIAVNLCKNHLSGQNRWSENTQQIGAELHNRSEELMCKMKEVFYSQQSHEFEIKEHINYCFNCINKTLLIKQQISFLLKEVYGFSLKEIAQVTQLTHDKVKHALSDARKHMNRIFDNKCSLINKNGTCNECTVLKGLLNPKQDAHIKANQIKLIREKESINEDLLNLRLSLVKGIDPLNANNTIFHTYLLENNPKWVKISKEI